MAWSLCASRGADPGDTVTLRLYGPAWVYEMAQWGAALFLWLWLGCPWVS